MYLFEVSTIYLTAKIFLSTSIVYSHALAQCINNITKAHT